MWKHASERSGDVEITVEHLRGCFRIRGIDRKIYLTLPEYRFLEVAFKRNVMGECKPHHTRVAMERAAEAQWKDAGAVDDLVMRTIAPYMVCRYLSQTTMPGCWTSFLLRVSEAPGLGWIRHSLGGHCSLRLRRRPYLDPPSWTSRQSPSGPSTDIPPPSAPPYDTVESFLAPDEPAGAQAENVDDSAVRFAAGLGNGNLDLSQAFPGIIGTTQTPNDPKAVVGVLVFPVGKKPNVYTNCASNLEEAVRVRVKEKAQKCLLREKGHEALLERVGGTVRKFITCVLPESKLDEFRVANPLLEFTRSNKWSQARWDEGVKKMETTLEPRFQHAGQVKAEPMPEGKAPRMICADGDSGQVLSAYTIGCLEYCVKKYFPLATIKGRGKKLAMEQILGNMRMTPKEARRFHSGFTAYEGDGSAWDTKCSTTLRDCIENPMIKHILASHVRNGDVHPEWADALREVIGKPKLRIIMKNKKFQEYLDFTIDAIRRSGDRGTSILNWVINYVCTICAIFAHPWFIVQDPTVRIHRDLEGNMRFWVAAYEGDDSAAMTAPKISANFQKQIEDTWIVYGHQMKLVFSTTKINFVGNTCTFDRYGPLPELTCPDLARAMSNSGVSCSPGILQAWRDHDDSTVASIAVAKAVSRAYDFAGVLPTVSRKYLEYASSLLSRDRVALTGKVQDDYEGRELRIRVTGDMHEHVYLPDVVREIEILNSEIHPDDELKRLHAIGHSATAAELAEFVDWQWTLDSIHDTSGFVGSLPATWRQ